MTEPLESKLTELRKKRDEAWELARKSDQEHKRLSAEVESLAQYLHELDGISRNCPSHEFVSKPSGRGIGFDEQCRRCGHFRTLYPVY